MKNLKSPDCEVMSPPCECFIKFPETESDLAFLAELVDLPTANRAAPRLMGEKISPERIEGIVRAGRTSRIGMQSLASHLQDSPNSNEEYANKILDAATAAFGVDRETILRKAFWVRTFWY